MCRDGVCLIYGSSEETILHVMWECEWARKMWKHTFFREVCKAWKENDMLGLFLQVVAQEMKIEWFAMVTWHL